MDALNEQLVESIDRYIEGLFTCEDATLSRNVADAAAAAMPAIQVSPNQGKLLYLIARIAGAKRILEIGTLAGYSTTWLARALPDSGELLTLEREPKYAEVARRNLQRAGVMDRVEIRVGPAGDSLRQLIEACAEPFDLVFIDADKAGYPAYLDQVIALSRPGTVILADNVIRNGSVIDPEPPDPADAGARAYNAGIAAHPRLESLILPIIRSRIDGLAISVVKSPVGVT
jgi:predicted O-methyltransferase YrrM